jgi:hypothetical protein
MSAGDDGESAQAADSTTPPPPPQPDPVRARRGAIRLRWWITAAVIVLAAAGTGIGLAVSGGSSGPPSAASKFDQVYHTYHARIATQSAALSSALGQAQGFDITAANTDAAGLESTYQQYANAVKAITMPQAAAAPAGRLVQVADAGEFLMNQAAGFFTASAMQSLLNDDWPQVKDDLTQAESALLAALGLTT